MQTARNNPEEFKQSFFQEMDKVICIEQRRRNGNERADWGDFVRRGDGVKSIYFTSLASLAPFFFFQSTENFSSSWESYFCVCPNHDSFLNEVFLYVG